MIGQWERCLIFLLVLIGSPLPGGVRAPALTAGRDPKDDGSARAIMLVKMKTAGHANRRNRTAA